MVILCLKKHLQENPANDQYTSKFSTVSMIEAIDIWVERKLLESLKASPFFSILADECQDVSTQEELSICFSWIVNGCPEEHFMTILYVKSTDPDTITKAITSYLQEKNLNCKKLVGQGYDRAATFFGCRSGVQRRIRTHAAHEKSHTIAHHKDLQMDSQTGTRRVLTLHNNIKYVKIFKNI